MRLGDDVLVGETEGVDEGDVDREKEPVFDGDTLGVRLGDDVLVGETEDVDEGDVVRE